jgi:hypothetical protein
MWQQIPQQTEDQEMTPAIAGSNVVKILSTKDVDLYNIAEDATQWSTSVKAIHQHVVQYDIIPIFCIPDAFNADTASMLSTFVSSIIR